MRSRVRAVFPPFAFVSGMTLLAIGAACSLDGLSGGTPDAGRTTDGAPTASNTVTQPPEGPPPVPPPPPPATVDCPSTTCLLLADQQEAPTELIVLTIAGQDLVAWIESGGEKHVSDVPRDGGLVHTDSNIGAGHDLTQAFLDDANGQAAYAIDSSGTMKRWIDYSTCTNVDGFEHLGPFGTDMIFVKSGQILVGDCGASTMKLFDAGAGVVDGVGALVYFARNNGDIVSCDASGTTCSTTKVLRAKGQTAPTTLKHDSDYLVWIAAGEVRGLRLPGSLDGGSPILTYSTPPDSGTTNPKALVLADGYVWWTDSDQGTVNRAKLNQQAPVEIVVRNLDHPWGIAVDTGSVYFAETNANKIWRVTK